MKTKLAGCLSISMVALIALSGHAQVFSDMAGVWNGVAMDVPAQIMPQFSGNLVTNVLGHDAFGANAFAVTAYSNGTFTNGPVTGTMTLGGQGAMTVVPAGIPPISFRVNYAEDIFAGISANSSGGVAQDELNLVVRSPAAFSTNAIVGTWQVITLDTPKELVQNFLPTTNGSAVSDLVGLDNESVTNSPLSQIGNGYMTFDDHGNLSGNVGNGFTGTYALAANGGLELSINTGSGTFPLAGYINASLDTIVALHDDSANNRQEIVMLTKPPTNAVIADLQGAWKVTSFDVPTQVWLTHDSSNFVTSVTASDGFSLNQQAFAAGYDGFVTGILDGGANIGGVSITTNGVATITFTNLAGETQTHTGQLNAGKNCITLVENNGSQLDFTVVVKAPDFPSTVGLDSGLLLFGTNIYWAAGTNRVLQSSSNLAGGWSDLVPTKGKHQSTPEYTNQFGFFRVGNF